MGYFRLFLCIPILMFHLRHMMAAGPIAVMTLFLLAGFLTARVTNEVYKGGLHSKFYFLLNRALRLYPNYLICLLLSILIVKTSVPLDKGLYWELSLPDNTTDWIKQFTILGLSTFTALPSGNTLLIPTWSLSTEIFYYLLIGVVLAGSRKAITWAFFIAVTLTAIGIIVGFDNYLILCAVLYFTIQGPAAIFLFGAMCYHYQHYIGRYAIKSPWLAILITNILLYAPDLYFHTLDVNTIYAAIDAFGTFEHARNVGLLLMYAPLPIFGWIIISLNRLPFTSGSFEEICADFSYPLFLIHCSVGYYIRCHFPELETFSSLFFAISAFYSVLISIFLVITVERPMKKYRKLVRQKTLVPKNI